MTHSPRQQIKSSSGVYWPVRSDVRWVNINSLRLFTVPAIKSKACILTFLFMGAGLLGQASYPTEKPWTYWWWMGSAVDQVNIRAQLEDFADAGLGGVHIIPIYGVKGKEAQFLEFLSESWLAMVKYTQQEAERLGLGVDLSLGTGWPYGGPWISPEYSARKLVTRNFPLQQSGKIQLDMGQLRSQYDLSHVVSVWASLPGKQVDLTPHLKHDILSHELPGSNWNITLFGIQHTRQMVKRAAPGGEGLVLDYFEKNAVQHYLRHFDSVFTRTAFPIHPRALYHDSYEVYGANWTRDFPLAFQRQHAYDLRPYLSLLNDPQHPDYAPIIHDIRATLAELLYTEFTSTWTDWSHRRHYITRNQAHGSPANLLDLYGLSSIPETESFGCSDFDIPGLSCDPDYEESRFGRPSPLLMKFASSPAHLLNKPLVSAETGTWLANHFKVSLRQVKPQVDELFTAGINHIFYHGITYSPEEEGFPGWLFYASTNFGKTSHFWDEFPLMNRYIETCQSLLQGSQPDNNILLYFPIHDLWTRDSGEILLMMDVHHADRWFHSTSLGRTAELLWNHGCSFDYVSDRQIRQLEVDANDCAAISGKSSYQVLIVPALDYIPEETLAALEKLRSEGLQVIFVDHFPIHYSGLLARKSGKKPVAEDHPVIKFRFLLEALDQLEIPREELSAKGLDFVRKSNVRGKLYFVTNLGHQFCEDSLALAARYRYVSILDPQTHRRGCIETSGHFRLKIPPGKSYFIQTLDSPPEEPEWIYSEPVDTVKLNSGWTVCFQEGQKFGLKEAYQVDSLTSWTTWKEPALELFCGKARYVSNFALNDPDANGYRYILHMDQVHESARVFLNGKEQGTLWAFPNTLELSPGSLQAQNQIKIVVQNLSANYMKSHDQQHPGWKKFYDINMVDITYHAFDPSQWPLEPSGLTGRVYITRERIISADGEQKQYGSMTRK